MKKFLNQPKDFVDEMLEGILLAHPDQLAFTAGDRRCIIRAGAPKKGKVAIATGAARAICPCSWAMWARECWTAVPSAASFSPLAPNRCTT